MFQCPPFPLLLGALPLKQEIGGASLEKDRHGLPWWQQRVKERMSFDQIIEALLKHQLNI
jgi:hypothetical protein